jgi:4-amino-4-deoxy-L-arabinose transferase-like glycosyltransferase
VATRFKGFPLALAAMAAGGLLLRLLYALVVRADDPVTGDGREFHLLARVLADEGRYLQPFQFLVAHTTIPTAEKPLLYPLVLALPAKLGLGSYGTHHLVDALLGAATIVLVGLLGRRVAGARAGLAAAALAAVFPMMIVLSGSARSESLYALLVAGALLAAYRLVERPRTGPALVLGVLVGLATLTRSEALALLVLLVLPAVWLLPAGARLKAMAVATLACLLVVAPWVARNWITFDRPALSTNEGGLLLGANCDAAYYSSAIGTWPCYSAPPRSWGTNEAVISARNRRRALDYVSDHLGRVPWVVAVRMMRTWELYDPPGNANIEHTASDRDLRVQQLGIATLWLLLPLGAYGALRLRARGQPLRLLAAPLVLVTVVSALSYGSSRFRAAADVPLVVLAGAGVVEARVPRSLRARRSRPPRARGSA